MSQFRLALGTVQFGMDYGIVNERGMLEQTDIDQILQFAVENNIDTLDTSLLYGKSMERLQNFFRSSKAKFKIINKFSTQTDLDTTFKELDTFLTNSGLASYEALLIHDPQAAVHDSKKLEAFLKRVKDMGMAEKIGCSIYTQEQFERMNAIFPMEIVQCPANPFQTAFLKSNVLPHHVEVHARSLFLQGVLLAKKVPEKLLKIKPILDKFHETLSKSNLAPMNGLMLWAKAQKNISKWVIGVTSLQELKQIVHAYGSAKNNPNSVDFNYLSQYDEPLLNPIHWNK